MDAVTRDCPYLCLFVVRVWLCSPNAKEIFAGILVLTGVLFRLSWLHLSVCLIMSEAGDDDLLDDFLAAAGIGGSASRDTSPDSGPSTSKPTPKKRKNPPKSSSSKSKRRKRSYNT